MKANVDASEQNLSNFVTEMNQLLDQHEIGSVIGQALLPSQTDLVNMGLNSDGGSEAYNQIPGGMGETGGEVH